MMYIDTADFPQEFVRKRMIRDTIYLDQVQRWKTEMANTPELYFYSFIHHNFKPSDLWYAALRNPIFVKTIANAVNAISGNVPAAVMSLVNINDDGYHCQGCCRDLLSRALLSSRSHLRFYFSIALVKQISRNEHSSFSFSFTSSLRTSCLRTSVIFFKSNTHSSSELYMCFCASQKRVL